MIQKPVKPRAKRSAYNKVERGVKRSVIGKAPNKEGERGQHYAPTPFYSPAPVNNKQKKTRPRAMAKGGLVKKGNK